MAGKQAKFFPINSSIISCTSTSAGKRHIRPLLNSTAMELCERKITKIYRALVNGIVNKDKVIIKQPIGLVRYPGVAKGLYVASPPGKPALSKVEVRERDVQRNCTLVQVEIQSGRPHQIRIHLAFLGHPLLGCWKHMHHPFDKAKDKILAFRYLKNHYHRIIEAIS